MALPQLENIATAGSAVLSQLATLDSTHGQQGLALPSLRLLPCLSCLSLTVLGALAI